MPPDEIRITGTSVPLNRTITAHSHCGIVLERRFNGASELAASLPLHWHNEYQIVLSETRLIEYRYRQKGFWAPIGSLVILCPEEPHAASVKRDLSPNQPLQNLNIPVSSLKSVCTRTNLPAFPHPVLKNPAVFLLFKGLCTALVNCGMPQLAKDVFCEHALSKLLAAQPHAASIETARHSRSSLMRARDFLAAHSSEAISLQTLADLTGLSRFHFVREFRRCFGMPPHAYQRQLRLQTAKALLLRNASVCEAALASGFYDQAHLTRVFKALTGVTPGRYRAAQPPRVPLASNPVQDARSK